jgi:hypothetical protein
LVDVRFPDTRNCLNSQSLREVERGEFYRSAALIPTP